MYRVIKIVGFHVNTKVQTINIVEHTHIYTHIHKTKKIIPKCPQWLYLNGKVVGYFNFLIFLIF